MKFYQRLAFYLFGLLLGIIFLVYFLQGKAEARDVSFCYLPNCRVLQDLRKKPLQYSDQAKITLQENWVTLQDVKNTLQYGDVDFSISNEPFKNGKIYFIEGKTTANEPIIVSMINYSEKAVLYEIKKDIKKQ
ncbi:DUF4258 domain-containing protein [Flavobacterium sp. NST-5]|uniref:DUF4258 domain-containing protein n=1 Tax=Flavobacterium ichthyis TaxID=2698827 RepID=A0ABW9Z8W8_9FLAO|nr:DUF4258 domain-containing protein [Flavobacterium ichthyis]NBL65161.1 DUF4258 domain-containing protein [Flavobacterium ichthyis]